MTNCNKLRQYQIDGVNQLIAFNRDAILADEPGLGKTIQVAHYINLTKPNKILIVCPASLRTNWGIELGKWLEFNADYQILSYEGTAKNDISGEYDLAVFDEAHYLKNPKAARTKRCLGLKAKRKLYLTGTPIINRPMDMFPILQSIGLKMTMTDFGRKYCAGYLQLIRYNPRKYAWNFNGASNTDKLNELLTKNCMVRRRKADVLTELPAKVRQVIELSVKCSEDKNLRKTMLKHFRSFTDAADAIGETLPIPFTELASYRLEQARTKLPLAIEYIKNLVEEVGKVVVFAYHREIINELADNLPNSVKLYGGMIDKQKQKAVDDFQRGDAQVFVGQITAAGTGLTLTASSTVVFVELDWVPGNVIQAEDRCHRLGQKDTVHAIHLVVKDTIDSLMVKALVRKQKIIEEVINAKE